MSSVAPGMWNAWRAGLVHELFRQDPRRALRQGAGRSTPRARRSPRRGPGRSERTRPPGCSPSLPDRYFDATPPEDALRHAVLLRRARRFPIAAVLRRTLEGHAEVHVAAADAPGLLATWSGVLAAHGLDILSARIVSTADGYALDVFEVRGRAGRPVERTRWRRARADLVAAARGKLDVPALLARRRGAGSLHRALPPVATRVSVDNRASQRFTVVDVRGEDRLGLLHDLAAALAGARLEIAVAKVGHRGQPGHRLVLRDPWRAEAHRPGGGRRRRAHGSRPRCPRRSSKGNQAARPPCALARPCAPSRRNESDGRRVAPTTARSLDPGPAHRSSLLKLCELSLGAGPGKAAAVPVGCLVVHGTCLRFPCAVAPCAPKERSEGWSGVAAKGDTKTMTDKDNKGSMTVAEAGRKGGETVRNERGREFYETIGRKGGATVKAERGRAFYEEIGRKGGETVKAERGAKFYEEIGKKGGDRVKATRGASFYEEIGRKGGQKVKKLIEEGKRAAREAAAAAAAAGGPAPEPSKVDLTSGPRATLADRPVIAPLVPVDGQHPQPRTVGLAVQALEDGQLLGYPSDTTYALGCDAHQRRAVERLAQLKHRDPKKPFALLVADLVGPRAATPR